MIYMIINKLATEFNLDRRLLAHLIKNGIDTADKMRRFLYPEIADLTPIESYSSISAARDRIISAIERGERILIYGDYDCDGICATAMLYMFLTSRNMAVSYYIPLRHSDGYGISLDACSREIESKKIDLLITVDCGISEAENIKIIRQRYGIDVIVTDHHIPPDNLPECILFNPKLDGVFGELSGSGVVLRLIEALSDTAEMLKYIDIAAIATIADIVPLISDNRIIAHHGLSKLKANPLKGIKLLNDISKSGFTASDIAYKLAPRINASGRLTDANKVVNLFTSDDYFILMSIAKEIDSDNNARRKMSDSLYLEALDMLNKYDLIRNKIIILHNKRWDVGILGIAAARLSREFLRPVILLTSVDGAIKGSGRSVEGVNLYDSLLPFKAKLLSFGGHSQAVGLSFADNGVINEILKHYNNIYKERMFNKSEDFIEIELNDIKIFTDLMKLEPFGCGNKKPSFKAFNRYEFMPIGNTPHIKAQADSRIEIVGFNMINRIMALNGIKSEIVLDLNINKYNGYGQAIINKVIFTAENTYNDYICAQYIKQLLYGDKAECRYKTINDLSEIRLINSGGTLFIASKPETCYNILNKYDIEYYIGVKDSLNPVNALILAPLDRNVTRYYKRVVFVDKPLAYGYIDRFNRDTVEDIYILDGDAAQIHIEDNILAVAEHIRQIIKENTVRTLEYLYFRLLKRVKCTYLTFSSVFYMMYELNIIEFTVDNIMVVKERALDFGQSDIYRRINELRGLQE